MEYEGQAFHEQFEKGRKSGKIRTTRSHVNFETDGASVSFPINKIKIERGGAAKRLVYFSHPDFPDWKFYTSDPSILNDQNLKHLHQTQIKQAKKVKMYFILPAAIVSFLVIASIALIFIFRGTIIRKAAEQVPQSVEESIGETAFETHVVEASIVDDEEINATFKDYMQPLLDVVEYSGEFKIFIVEDPSLNAFAIPGGWVVVHTGTILHADRIEEVLGVMAHELAHVTRKHSMQNMISSLGMYAVLQIVFGDVSGLVGLGAKLKTLKNSREFEHDADKIGFEYLIKANIDPKGMIEFFERVDEEYGHDHADQMEFLSTHPVTEDRIDNMQDQLTEHKNKKYRTFNKDFKAFQKRLKEVLGSKTDKKEKQNQE